MTTATLAEALPLPCGAVLPNRIAKAAMSEQLGDRSNRPTQQLDRLYERWGRDGAGLVITGNVMIDRRHVGEPRNVVVEDARDLPALRRWADAGRAGGSALWVQVNHPGRQALRIAGAHPVGPSAVAPKLPGAVTPRALTPHEIEQIVARFATTAAVVRDAGFDGVQLHGAHGYLISQFLSPRANVREDEWGGDAERRRRFALEVVGAVRAAVGDDFAVGIKLNSADFQRGGFSEDESVEVVAALAEAGVDLVEISGGTYESPAMMGGSDGDSAPQRASTAAREAYFLDYAERVRERVPGLPLMVTGGFRSLEGMAAAIGSGACDVVGIGRPLALHPDAVGELLAGTRARVDAGKRGLGVRRLDSAIDLFWHTRQLQRIGRGREPWAGEHALQTFAAFLLTNGWGAARRRRGG
ncbi:NADH:flavin oxidoreductase/NADH oxidase family protein [Conexibacter sp. JD483]|uniref:NADH:flavin oxidoreductase/NADH oxidase family protein n=1 Tax=unclassified Conexibacter TaxID=2627773 RepID=UPI002724B07D|nr:MULTISPECIES: NADH:flavin oxidoreductase/NADH oxidase family protein [unclassified Conexibacter]MDO8186678.1 NADH:flavin oxidoreductase/NADH oxidase family protein [Conexibacter sp. CPCC 205706]MDO8200398.1 NADH:flavin oxidoreductase/NADH oxidase family protein [Conexibacter sp. CPCC 205762]MDR9371062.1 NADH:flavin oxidoreductase/NADH oxidase family protein [Conexibacter sp. JD483]